MSGDSRARPLWMASVSGSVGGACCTIVGHPLDTVKVRLQTGHTAKMFGSLYAGIASPLVAVTPMWMMSYWSYRAACNAMQADGKASTAQPTSTEATLAGIFSGVTCGALRCVVDNVKANAQVNSSRTSWSMAQEIVRKDGPTGLFRGLSVTVPYSGVVLGAYYAAYEWSCAILPKDDLGPVLSAFVAGSFAGLVRWVPFLPLDIVRQHVYLGSAEGVYGIAQRIWQQSGVRGFYRGWLPTVLRAVPANGAAFIGITQTERLLNNHFG